MIPKTCNDTMHVVVQNQSSLLLHTLAGYITQNHYPLFGTFLRRNHKGTSEGRALHLTTEILIIMNSQNTRLMTIKNCGDLTGTAQEPPVGRGSYGLGMYFCYRYWLTCLH